MELRRGPHVEKVPTAQCSQHPRFSQEVTNDQTKEKKNKQPVISLKVIKVPAKVKKCKKESNRDLKPCTAHPCPGAFSAFDSYQTTFMRDFPYRPGSAAELTRPRSSNGYTYPYQLQEPIGDSSYTKDYPWKCVPNQQPMQSGALWGCGKNNVDPCQSLMLWNLLKKDRDMYDRVPAYFVKPMSSEDIAQVEAYQYNTVYRQDYLGMQQEFQMKCPPCLPNIGRTEPCYPLTDNQYHYRKPNQKPELAICTSRYGSNKHWKTAAKGIVPRAIQAHIQKQEKRKHVTTYERDYGRINMNFAKILKSLEPKAFKSYLESLPLRDQEVLLQFLDNMM